MKRKFPLALAALAFAAASHAAPGVHDASVSPFPEPVTMVLLAVGIVGMALRIHRQL